MNLLARIFLDSKVKNETVQELENDEKAINRSSNARIRHGWNNLKASGTKKKCTNFGSQYMHKLGNINFSRIWRARRELINFQIPFLCAQSTLY